MNNNMESIKGDQNIKGPTEMNICFSCNISPGILEEEGVFFCNECLLQQKEQALAYYINKKVLTPNFNQITDKIYLGNEDTARSKDILEQNKINNILICAKNCEKFFPDVYKYEILHIDDAIDENILSWFPRAFKFIDSSENNVLVHCVMGISRSVTVVIGYLMYKKKIPFQQAFDLVKSKRPQILPNSGFINQLKECEKELMKYNYKIDYLNK